MMEPCVPRRGCRAPCATRFPHPGRVRAGGRDRRDWRPPAHRRGSSEAPPETRPQPLPSRRAVHADCRAPPAPPACPRSTSCAATNSCVARSSLSRSARDSRSLGVPASSETARKRTPRIGSVRAARRTARADPAARRRACRARRCAPSGLDPEALSAPVRHSPERRTGASPASAPARAKDGALASAATAASSTAAPGSSCHAAWKASP